MFQNLRMSPRLLSWTQRQQPIAYSNAEDLYMDLILLRDEVIQIEGVTNDMIDYLNKFIELFDNKIYKTVEDILRKWQEDGTLNVIISEALKWELDNLENELEEITLNVLHMPLPFNSARINDSNFDNAPVIQKAVDYLYGKGGGTIFLPSGEYNWEKSVKWKSGVSLVGSGSHSKVKMKGSLFSAIINTDGSSTGSDGVIPETYLTGCTFDNFQIDGSGLTYTSENADGKGIFILYMKNCYFNRLYIHHTIGTGLGCDFLDKVSITNCVVEHCGRNWTTGGVGQSGIGVGTNSNKEESLYISGNVCRNNGNYGIFVETQNNPRENGTILSQGARIEGNYCYGNRIGIGNKGSGGTITTGNYIGFNVIGLQLTEKSFGDLVANNRIEDNTQQGIFISGDYKGKLLVDSNIIKRNRKGIEFIDGQLIKDISIKNNDISENQYAGIEVGNLVDRLQIISNTLTGNAKANVSGQRQAILFRRNLRNLSLLTNTFEKDESQLIAIQMISGATLENTTIQSNHAITYDPQSFFYTDEITMINVTIEMNSGVPNEARGTITMNPSFDYQLVTFNKAFDKSPIIVQVIPVEGSNQNRFWVTNITRSGFMLRTDVKGEHTVRYGALR